MARRLFAVLVALLAQPALADTGSVLIVANQDYQTLRDARGAGGVLAAEGALVRAGFDVDVASDLSANALRSALSSLSDSLRSGLDERVVFVFAGYTISADHGVWLMGTDSRAPDFATIEGFGVRLETVLALAGQVQGGAVVAIADYGFPESPRTGFRAGLPASIAVPQGVTLVHGPGASVAGFLRDLGLPGVNLGRAASARAGLRLEGFNPPFLTFLPAGHQPSVAADNAAWAEAQAAATIEAYETYLSTWPDGLHAAEAAAARERLLNTPERIEERLNLSRDERRAIQRDLALLGYDPRGVDGIFGRGTRSAIAAWQGANRFAQTGFVNRDQVFELAQQSARRAAQLEAEARERQQALERQDRAFWRDTGAGADEAGLRAYLGRFPEGIFASVARERLGQIETTRERAAWQAALAAGTIPAFEAYLRDYPRGTFAEQARARIEDLRVPVVEPEPVEPETPREVIDAAREEEDTMNLPGFLIEQIERRLDRLGHNPGAVDGVIDRQTRRAIRRYQREQGLPVTGYLTVTTIGRVLGVGIDFLR